MDDASDEPGAPGRAVGRAVARRRAQRGMSAAELARRAGLGKATLSHLEAGDANPTIGTLHRIALALAIPLTDLVDETGVHGDVLTRAAEPDEGTDPEPISRTLLDRMPTGSTLEVWRLRMAAGESFVGVPHAAGTVEALYCAGGALDARTAHGEYALAPGDLLRFDGDQPHSYRTDPGGGGADVVVLLASP